MGDISLLLLLSIQSRGKKSPVLSVKVLSLDNIEFGIVLKEEQAFHGSLRDVIS